MKRTAKLVRLRDSQNLSVPNTSRCCKSGIVRAGKGFEHDGNKWTCTCGIMWMYIEEYPEGGYWMEWGTTKNET